jgi:Uma2 family endonuclease
VKAVRRARFLRDFHHEEAGIPHYWWVEDGKPVVHVYELDLPTSAYAPAGIFRGSLSRTVPFEIGLDLDELTPPRR